MSARQRLTFAGIAVLIAVVAVVAIAAAGGSDDRSEPSNRQTQTTDATPEPTATQPAEAAEEPEATATKPPEPKVPTVVVEDGAPVGGVKEVRATEGDQVRFRVVSDVADHVHVHGYDLMKDVSAGGQTTFSFKATITGIFEAELEDRGEQIVSLRVDPK